MRRPKDLHQDAIDHEAEIDQLDTHENTLEYKDESSQVRSKRTRRRIQ